MRHCLFGLLMVASITANAEIQTQEIPYTAADG
ncbi:MAG: dienelactone hydrolase, partial [Gammaproteobacteria bacterium HGW-Gammaproteobacteria-6]